MPRNMNTSWQRSLRAGTILSSAVAIALLGGTPALAQSSDGEIRLDTITVTAERRETSLQDTPLSVLAFSSENLELKGVDDLQDVAAFSPNLEIKPSRGGGNNTPTFQTRGISGGGVGIYIDDIYVPSTNIAVLRTLDLARVEVLRGPQGTNFGRNSTGGAVRLFTKQPTNEYEGYVKLTGGNYDRRDMSAMVNIPLTDSFFIRAQGSLLNEDGYVERGTQMLGSSDDKIGRVQARWEASERITATFGFLYSKSTSDGSPQDIITFDMRPGLEGVWEGNYGDWVSDFLENAGQAPIAPLDDPRFVLDDFTMPDFCFIDDADPDWDKACELRNDTKYVQTDAKLEFQLSDNVSLTSTTAYTEIDVSGISDWQEIGTEVRPNGGSTDVFWQEFLFNASLFDGALDLIAGGNYYHEKNFSDDQIVTRRGTSIANPFVQDPITGVYGFANGDGDAGLFIRSKIKDIQKQDSLGAFASGTWHITDKLNFTGGLRFTYDQRDVDRTEYASADFTPVAGTDSTNVTTDHSWNQLDWRATLDYQITMDHMIYATASKAYKAGAFSFSIADEVPGPDQSGDFITPINPEKVKNLEAGARTEWLDGRIRFNPTVFYMMWSNRQAARQVDCSSEGVATCPIGFRIQVVDSGDVDLYGTEMDAQIAVTNQFTIDGNFGYTGYDLKDPVANSGPNLFPAPSKYSYNVGANYAMPMEDLGGDVTFSLNWAWQSSQPTHPTEGGDSGFTLPSYGVLNGRIRWTSEDQRISLTGYVNNLLDNNYYTYATSFGGGYWDVGGPPRGGGAPFRRAINVTRARPQNWGVTLQYNF